MRSVHHRKPSLEILEDRSLLAVGILDNGWLGVLGTKGSDYIEINGNGSYVSIVENGVSTWSGYAPTVAILALAGDDRIEVSDNVTISIWVDGGKGNDDVRLGSGDDVFLGGKGNDVVLGGAGNDYLFGDGGNDFLLGGSGIDVISGGKGNDLIAGDDDGDFLSGDAGHDEIYAGLGDDIVDGGSGRDLIEGGDGIDELMGFGGVDLIFGDAGDDLIDGGAGNDRCSGGIGDDRIKGGAGSDQLNGDDGNNILDRDKGKDQLINGIEADLDSDSSVSFVYANGGSGTASYQFVNDNGVLQVEFQVDVQNFPSYATLNVHINNVNVGQIVTDGSGSGKLELSTAPSRQRAGLSSRFSRRSAWRIHRDRRRTARVVPRSVFRRAAARLAAAAGVKTTPTGPTYQ